MSPHRVPYGAAIPLVERKADGLENRCGPYGPPRVRIPPPPLNRGQSGRFAAVLVCVDRSTAPRSLPAPTGVLDPDSRTWRDAGSPHDRTTIARFRFSR